MRLSSTLKRGTVLNRSLLLLLAVPLLAPQLSQLMPLALVLTSAVEPIMLRNLAPRKLLTTTTSNSEVSLLPLLPLLRNRRPVC